MIAGQRGIIAGRIVGKQREVVVHYRQLGRTGLQVSELGLGALEVGRPWGIAASPEERQPPCEEEADKLLNRALDVGVNFIDTAAAYWASEERIGRCLRNRRQEFTLASKWGEWCDESGSAYDYSPRSMWDFLESSLRALQTDHIDVYQIHSAPMEVIVHGDALAEMQKAKEQGKIRYIGVSCGETEAATAIAAGGFDTIQVSYNLLDTTMERRVLPLAQEHNIGVIIKDGLAAGKLTQKVDTLDDGHQELKAAVYRLRGMAGAWKMSLPEAALRFVLSNPAVSTVIAGTRSVVHLEENLRAADGRHFAPIQLEKLRLAV